MSNLLQTVEIEFSSSALTGSPQNFGSPLAMPAIKVQFINESTVDCYIKDGVSTWRIPGPGTITLDESVMQTNHGHTGWHIAQGAQLTITQVTAAGTGTTDIYAHIVMERINS